MSKKNSMTFGDMIQSSWATYAQDVIINKKVVGALITERVSPRQALLKESKEWYQVCAPEDEKDKFDWHYPSEDMGYVYGCFKIENEDKFLQYVKENQK